MSEEHKLNSMAEDDLDDVVGGWGYILEKGGATTNTGFPAPLVAAIKR
jgi:hypothetical protein